MSSSGRSFLSHPKKAIFLIILIVVALATSVYAYLELFSPKAGPRVSVISYPLELSMELNKTEFQQGEDITIRISLKNIGNETIVVDWADYYLYDDAMMYFDFCVMDANNRLVYQWTREHAALAAVREETLNPDEMLVSVYVWRQKTCYPERAQVPKGTYIVKGLSRYMGLTVQDQITVIKLETPTITFVIRSTPVEFSIELDKTEFQQGEDITIRLSITNIGNETITLTWPQYYLYMDTVMYFDFHIGQRAYYIADLYTLVYRWTKGRTPIPAELKRSLNPGDQLISVYVWNQMNNCPEGYPEAQVPRGTYNVNGLADSVGLIIEGRTSVITLETPTITFTIK